MNLLGIVILAGGIALNIYIYYLFFNITLAYWTPEKSNEKWISFISNPVFLMFHPFFKYVAPLWILCVSLTLLILGANFILSVN